MGGCGAAAQVPIHCFVTRLASPSDAIAGLVELRTASAKTRVTAIRPPAAITNRACLFPKYPGDAREVLSVKVGLRFIFINHSPCDVRGNLPPQFVHTQYSQLADLYNT